MSAIYIETSAVLHWLFGQANAAEVRRQLDGADHVVTSVITLIEVERAIIRAERLEVLNAKDAKRLRTAMNSVKRGWVILSLSEAVQRQAMRDFPVEPIRTLDALHLASAMVLIAAYPGLRVLSYDARINDNARALRLLS